MKVENQHKWNVYEEMDSSIRSSLGYYITYNTALDRDYMLMTGEAGDLENIFIGIFEQKKRRQSKRQRE